MAKKKSEQETKRKRLIIASATIIFILIFIYIISGLPSLEELENPKPILASKVYSSDGELIGQFFIENRIETNIDSLPKHLIEALIATEDKNFYDHWGVDLGRFFKAMIKNIITLSFTEGEGASTITQQCAKNLYNLKSGRENALDKVVRKIREWISAVQIERNFTKNEILELYLNVSYFGRGAYGIESAAKIYFNKKASELTLPEAALLIALLKSSEYYDPVKNYDNALRRRNVVLNNMVVNGYLSESDYQKLKRIPIHLATDRPSAIRTEAPHFMEYIRLQLTPIVEKYGYDLYRDGLNIYTTLDMKMQRIANRSAAKHISEYQELFNKNWNWDRNKSLLSDLLDKAIKNTPAYRNATDASEKTRIYNSLKSSPTFIDSIKKEAAKIEVGFVVIDPHNGFIKALVGGTNQEFGRGLNHVTGIRRQPGSSFKPFVYATAIENGYYPAYTLLNQKFDYNGWSPDNADNEYTGYETLRWGLAYSVNVIAGRMTISDIAPPSQVISIAKRMGIKSKLDPFPAIALGTMEVSPLEMTSAFGTFANNGVHIEPISVIRIEDRNGILIEEFSPQSVQAISPQTASIMADMMQDVVNYGTGAGVRRYFQYPAAGKTGTTQKFSDAWFVGFTPDLVAGVWVGFDDHRVKFTNWYGQGAKAALPIWAMFMQAAYKELNLPLRYFELSDGVETATFCKETMKLGDTRLATENCPETYTDIINSNNLPASCEIHGGGRIIRENRSGESGWSH
ncbi:MAG: PBP1A family penicillin-binding protein [Ignavibacterium album]|uniref:penicillin-binding protein 1A n=1 Tax=Ignavibacterium album TaxID=591197 RepID=UPI0026F22881|nr:PBP1A family penicillin-binding protein [Ignavibacterium album]MBI5662097.1 PBP1A family penicillin-binding protein [Ignavibacterium album]